MCVQLTAMDAFLREFRTWVPSDCTAAESTAAKTASLAYMKTVLKCDTSAGSTPAARRPPRKKSHA
jgi:nicotinamidase-related amidase